jgi:hypothetical protein
MSIQMATDDIIIQRLDKLIEIINALPYPVHINRGIQFLVASDFHSSWQFDDDVNTISYKTYMSDPDVSEFYQVKATQGIQNLKQLNRYIHELTSNFKYVRKKALDDIFFSDNIKQIYPHSDKTISFRDVTLFTFLKKYNLNFIQDRELDFYLKQMLGSNFPYHINKRALKYNQPNPIDIVLRLMQQAELKFFLVDELEILVCLEAANKLHEIEARHLRYDYEPDYFINFTSTQLVSQFQTRMNEKLAVMPDDVKHRYLEISCNQFNSHEPLTRRNDIGERFWKTYLFPEIPSKMMNDSYFRYLAQAIDAYKLNFELFKNITESTFNINKLQLIDNMSNGESVAQDQPMESSLIRDILFPKFEESNTLAFNDYYNDWYKCTVTLKQWQEHVGFDMIHILKDYPLTDKEWDQILHHQYTLYNEYTTNLFNASYKNKFDQLQTENDKSLIAKRDLDLITDIIARAIDSSKEKQLQSIFSIKNWLYTANQFEHILRDKATSANNHNIWHEDCFAESEAIIMYRNYLKNYITTQLSMSDLAKHKTNKPPKSRKQIPHAFYYIKFDINNPAITKLFNALRKRLIDPDTELKEFRKIFNKTTPDAPITWLGSFEELYYFIKLIHHDFGYIEKMPKHIWKVTANLFIENTGRNYDWTKFHTQHAPPSAIEIENIVDILR